MSLPEKNQEQQNVQVVEWVLMTASSQICSGYQEQMPELKYATSL